MNELFVIEQSQRGKPGLNWLPLLETYAEAADAVRALRVLGPQSRRVAVYRRAGTVNTVCCEECEIAAYGDLPEGWAQYGKSRFTDAPSGIASHCPEHVEEQSPMNQDNHATIEDLFRYDCAACGASSGKPCRPLPDQRLAFEEGMFHSARASAFQQTELERIQLES